MGSSISAINDQLDREKWKRDEDWLNKLAESIKKINPSSSAFDDIEWLERNKEKILRNRSLINLLG